MCGIFGIVSNSNKSLSYELTNKIINTLFELSSTRGKESSGIAIKNLRTKKISVYKDALPASGLIKSKEYNNFISDSLSQNFDKSSDNNQFALISHARLVTNGTQDDNNNNQPVIKNGIVAVHNGIVVNVDALWKKHNDLNRQYTVDTEVIIELFKQNLKITSSISKAIKETFREIYGYASIALLIDDLNKMVIASNNGSSYCMYNEKNDIFIFASERYILAKLVENLGLEKIFGKLIIEWINPGTGYILDIENSTKNKFSVNDTENDSVNLQFQKDIIVDSSPVIEIESISLNTGNPEYYRSLLQYNIEDISNLKRCSKCLLPETFPFIHFDDKGTCNYCNNYKKIQVQGKEELLKLVEPYRNREKKPECLITFSGGRDSSYLLHYVVKELNMTPIAYSYDWGMITDLARRNQSRLCGKLGVEHILVSADIRQKRSNISKNVSAWLKKPNLGTIPLFMAGDKQYFYYANQLMKINNLDLAFLGENQLENTNFKSGFCGIKPSFDKERIYSLSLKDKIKMSAFYGKEYLLNPSYINSSLYDTLWAFFSYYVMPHNLFNIYNYIRWDEKIIEDALLNEYDWELSPDTKTTWRIGDGTAPFYNYIYYTVAGFSEIDTFRSNQIREGVLTREEALKLANDENKPRYESIKWYLDTIELDFDSVIKRINKIPKLYTSG